MNVEGASHPMLELARAYVARYLAVQSRRRRATATSAFGPSSEEVAVALLEPATGAGLDAEDRVVAGAHARLEQALQASPEPRLARLARVFSLSALDLAIICAVAAPDLDYELERVYAFAVDDFTRKRPDIGFVARLLGAPDEARIDQVLTRFDGAAPLLRHGIVTISSAGDAVLQRPVRLADRIVMFLRGHDSLDPLLHGFVRVDAPAPPRAGIVMSPDVIARIGRALAAQPEPPRVLLAGTEGSGRALAVEALLAESGRATMRIDLAAILVDGLFTERLVAAFREAALRDLAMIFDGGTTVDREVPRALVQAIADHVPGLAVPIVFTFSGHPPWLIQAVPSLIEVDVPPPNRRERLELWRRALPPPFAVEEDLETVAGRYAFTGAAIVQAARRAAQLARLREPAVSRVSLDDLGEAARLMFSHRLGAMAQRIPTGFTWDDLVLPSDTNDAVREVVRFAHHRAFLLEEWGFAAKLPYGRGLSAILAGPPGTGKTMVAQLIAKDLGYDLYRVDLSQIVNKYIGETEKNLAKIFDEAETSHVVLFFDEADSLFAKRTDIRSSNDRYANLEVNYLLQRMETFDGVTLLATNLEQGLDEAFKRRVRFTIQFELPDEAERRKLWQSMFPPSVPLAPNIDWDMIARSFVMAGGYIKKAALRAALIAVASRSPITTAHLLEAARLEYREMGRII